MSSLFFGILGKSFVLAGLAHPRDAVLFQGERITPVSIRIELVGARDAHGITGHAPSPLDALDTLRAHKAGEEGVHRGSFVGCFHACIIPSLEGLVKLFFEFFPILFVTGGVLFGVIPSREPCGKGIFEEFEELIVVLHACIIPAVPRITRGWGFFLGS